ncbi:YdcF family protein [Reichenbachiella sp. MALMAid0571]|uniref:YdcF family protein n=1 Tax=Reichenbachiella sp. MALMAid0571 TaxID=3143939 RepID=UPI0032DE367B
MNIPSEHIELALKLWNYHKIDKPFDQADLIIGLGSYDLKTAMHCAELLKRGVAPLLIFTGSKGNWTNGKWDKSEAEVFRDCAIEYGANPEQILIEPDSTNIGENLAFAKKALKDHDIKSTLIVTKPNTLRRAIATAEIQWPEIEHSADCVNVEMENQVVDGHCLEDLINEMVGDIQRIVEYPKKGFQSEQYMPEDIKQAYQNLIDLGYDKHIMM